MRGLSTIESMANPDSDGVANELPTLSSDTLRRLREKNPDGWRSLIAVFSPVVYRWSRQAGISEDESADIVQEVFASVARSLHRFRREQPSGSFRSWIATITRNKIHDHYRRVRRRPIAFGGTDAMAHWQEIAESEESSWTNEAISGQVARQALALLQAEFQERTWRAFWLTAIEDQPADGVARDLGMSLASVYQSKCRVLRRLREWMAEFPD